MTPEDKKQYFGMKPYTAVADTDKKTPTGIPILKVLYEDGSSVVTTEKFFSLMKSEVPLDSTKFRELLMPALMKGIFSVFTDYNVRQEDIDAIVAKIANTWNETFNNAVNFKMGISIISDIDMIMINDLNEQSEAAKRTAPAPTAPVATDGGADESPAGGIPIAA